MAHPRRRPAQGLFHEAYRVFDVEPATVRLPEQVEVHLTLSVPPLPQLLRLAGLPRQLAHLDQDHGTLHHGCPLAPVTLAYPPGLRVQSRPTPDAHRAVVVSFAAMFTGRLRPTRGVFELKLLAMAARASHRPRLALLRGCVEDPVGVQPDQDLHRASFQSALEFHRIVAGVED